MKRLFLTALLVSGLAGVMTESALAQQDSVKRKNRDSEVRYGINVSFAGKRDSTGKVSASKGRFFGGLTFTRLDWGFTRMVDNGSFTLSKTNKFLDYRGVKSSTFSFDFLQFGYRFNPQFKIYLASGIDWTMFRLNEDITLQKNSETLAYVKDDIHFSKNRLSAQYIHFPLNFEFRTKENHNGKRFYFVVGPEAGFLLGGMVKQVSKERGKEKFRDNYNFDSFRYGGTARIGYGAIGLFTKYYFNDMFTTPEQSGLKNISFGVTLGL